MNRVQGPIWLMCLSHSVSKILYTLLSILIIGQQIFPCTPFPTNNTVVRYSLDYWSWLSVFGNHYSKSSSCKSCSYDCDSHISLSIRWEIKPAAWCNKRAEGTTGNKTINSFILATALRLHGFCSQAHESSESSYTYQKIRDGFEGNCSSRNWSTLS